jgi:hypothetical protein
MLAGMNCDTRGWFRERHGVVTVEPPVVAVMRHQRREEIEMTPLLSTDVAAAWDKSESFLN